jgi:cytochrome c
MLRKTLFIYIMATIISAMAAPARSAGDAQRGANDFRLCAPCHSLQPDRNMTGPSLAGVWDRKAGGLKSFERYSPALKSSDVVWNAETLDAWLEDPPRFIPHSRMTFAGIQDAQTRADLIAYLKTASSNKPPQMVQDQGGGMGGMMGRMGGMTGMGGGGEDPDLRKADPAKQVRSVGYCHDTYRVVTADGETHDFWERNLRLKTDSGDHGPAAGAPALVAAGMMGDRADIIFAAPQEISAFINSECPSPAPPAAK